MFNISNIKIDKVYNNQFITHTENFSISNEENNFDIKFCLTRNINEIIPNNGWYANGCLSMVNRWSPYIKDGDFCIDIGAFDGDTSIPMAILAKSGKVFAFEPGLQFQYGLNLNCGFNPNLNISAYNLAITDKNGIDEFLYSDEYENGGHKFLTSKVGNYPRKRWVRTVNFHDFVNKESIDLSKVSFIKLDTEGFDVQILETIKSFISSIRPVIQIEVFPLTEHSLISFVNEMNYKYINPITGESYDNFPRFLRDDLILIPN